DFAVEPSRRPAPLSFAHTHHTREVIKREELEDVERACLDCHNAEPDGRSFAAIDFDRHCDACHLTATTSTPPLPVAGGAAPGVETVDQVLARGGPGVRWAAFSNPAEFRVRGGRVIKTPVYHRDPWVLDNLRRLRQALYPDAGLADLLVASAEVPEHELRGLYEEAIDTLEEQMVGLRARPEPEVRRELARIQETLDGLRRAVREPYTPLDGTRFALAVEDPRPELTAEQVAELEGLVAQLTQPCTQCHRVEKATIARVDDDLGLLRRAEFNHRAHIVQRRCLDCHSEIPILENVATEAKLNPAVDSAEIVNLPRIETCRECHAPRRAADRCVTCHLFHPDQSRRSELLLYLE
ncbi:MAG: cytochrome c3 family protein, partial [Thermoanaerobaculia bacterium]|nr:cytochrome c3 family protein [Thermoanaerobaculia bacterium]